MAQEQASNDWLSPMQELRDIRDRLNRRPEGRFDHPVMKVNQFDAYILDSELLDLVRHQVHRGLAFFRAGTMEQYKPEIDALLSFLLYWTTVLQNKPTPGMALQNLVYHDAFGAATAGAGAAAVPARRRWPWALARAGGPWALARLRRRGQARGWAERPPESMEYRIWALVIKVEKFSRLLWLVNTLLFLRYSKYPSFLDRLFGMKMAYAKRSTETRGINFQFMNRQLLWDHLAGFLLFAAPLVDWRALRARGAAALRAPRRLLARLGGRGGGWPRRAALLLPAPSAAAAGPCAVCARAAAQNPYIANCGHSFCYYCLHTGCSRDDKFSCPQCGEMVESSVVWTADPRF